MRKTRHSQDFITVLCDKRIEDPTLPMNTMNQNITDKNSSSLPVEIKKRKRTINKEFDKRFGKYFIPYIPDSVAGFQRQFRQFFFSPKSKFLNQFPKLKKCIYSQKKLDMEKLKSKINIGSLLYLNLREHLVSNKATLNDKIFELSKNYSLVQGKDELSTTIYKAKKKSANRFLNYKNLAGCLKNQNKNVESINNNNKNENMVMNKTYNNKDKENERNFLSIFKSISNEKKNINLNKTQNIQQCLTVNQKKTKNRFLKNLTYIPDYPKDEINNSLLRNNNNIYQNTYSSQPFYLYKNNIIEKNNQKENTETLTNSNTSISNNNNYFPFQSNITNNIRYMSIDNKNEISENNSNDFNISNLEIIPDNKSLIPNIKIMKTTANKEFNEKISSKKIRLNKSSNFSTNKIFDMNKIINIPKSKKFVKRINSKVQDLNSVASKCNNDLIKIIYINQGSKIKRKSKVYYLKNFDIINELLSDKKTKKKLISYQKKINKKETLKKFMHEANGQKSDLDKKNKKLEKKNFIKNINHLPDDLALYMVGNLYKTNKIKFSLKETANKRKLEKQIKNKNNSQNIRNKAKYNYVKMIRLENDLTSEKETFYKIYRCMENKKLLFNSGKNKIDFLDNKNKFNRKKCYSN